MIFMTMRQKDTANTIFVFDNMTEIRQNNINTEHIAVGKCHAAIDDKRIVLVFHKGDVFADFIQTAEAGDFDRQNGFLRFFLYRGYQVCNK